MINFLDLDKYDSFTPVNPSTIDKSGISDPSDPDPSELNDN